MNKKLDMVLNKLEEIESRLELFEKNLAKNTKKIRNRWAVPRYFLGTGTVGTFVVPIPRYFAIFWRYRYFSFVLFFSRDFTNVIKNFETS